MLKETFHNNPHVYCFAQFKELSLRFHQCPRDELAWETTRRWGRLSLHNIFHHANLINQCRDSERWSTVLSDTFKCCISATLPCTDCQPGTRLNICEICQHMPNAQPFSASVCSFDMNDTLVLTTAANLPSDSCRCSLASYDVSSYMSVCCTQCNKTISYSDVFSDHPFTSFTPKKMCEGRRPTDRYILDSLEKLPGKLCDKMAFQKSQGVFPRAIIQDVGRSDMPAGFTGKGCQENSTLRFIALDSQNHWMFAQRLGLDVSQAHVSPVVVVFDREVCIVCVSRHLCMYLRWGWIDKSVLCVCVLCAFLYLFGSLVNSLIVFVCRLFLNFFLFCCVYTCDIKAFLRLLRIECLHIFFMFISGNASVV